MADIDAVVQAEASLVAEPSASAADTLEELARPEVAAAPRAWRG